jgi:nucleotide-binding universal stress UspA family protein
MAPTRTSIERILCPVDFSEFSARALERAVLLARWFEARVEVLHVIPFVVPAGAGLPYFPAPVESTKSLRDQSRKELEKFVEPFLNDGAAVELKVLEGDPWRIIRDEAEALPADLLVMGTHGRGGFEHLLLGSVTEKVMRRAPCPVLTVGRVAPHGTRGPLFRNIVCASDLTESSARTVDTALSLAEENAAHLTLLHVVDTLPGEGGARLYLAVPEIGPLRRDLVAAARERLRQAVPDEARDFCDVSERVETGSAWGEILRVAEEVGADLIVMGEHVHGPIGRAFFGSTSSHVVRQATCPVLVVREARKTPGREEAVAAEPAAVGHAKGGAR